MKKAIAILSVAVLVLGLAACGEETTKRKKKKTTEEESTSQSLQVGTTTENDGEIELTTTEMQESTTTRSQEPTATVTSQTVTTTTGKTSAVSATTTAKPTTTTKVTTTTKPTTTTKATTTTTKKTTTTTKKTTTTTKKTTTTTKPTTTTTKKTTTTTKPTTTTRKTTTTTVIVPRPNTTTTTKATTTTTKKVTTTTTAKKNEYYNANVSKTPVSGKLIVRPYHVYWNGTRLVVKAYIINGTGRTVTNPVLNELILRNSKGVIASAGFGTIRYTNGATLSIPNNSYVDWTFNFSASAVVQAGADLTSLASYTSTFA